mmetsp:Transcript_5311/g.9022  ORF Transcript_5311/g.9022 Transcript_5311/m.9022 type:complete len:213 (-) Transcript_5311:69-707(-)
MYRAQIVQQQHQPVHDGRCGHCGAARRPGAFAAHCHGRCPGPGRRRHRPIPPLGGPAPLLPPGGLGQSTNGGVRRLRRHLHRGRTAFHLWVSQCNVRRGFGPVGLGAVLLHPVLLLPHLPPHGAGAAGRVGIGGRVRIGGGHPPKGGAVRRNLIEDSFRLIAQLGFLASRAIRAVQLCPSRPAGYILCRLRCDLECDTVVVDFIDGCCCFGY